METEMLDNQSLPAYVDPFLKLSEEYFSEASHHWSKQLCASLSKNSMA